MEVSPYFHGSRTSLKSGIAHRNPRQEEVWELQSVHQGQLNWLHFMARLEGREPKLRPYQPAAEDASLLSKEQELRETLIRERKLLIDAKTSVQQEIDRCKQMLEEFRVQRRKRFQEKQKENLTRKSIYEQELLHLKTLLQNEKSDIRVSIHQVDYTASSESDVDVSALNESSNLRKEILKKKTLKTKSTWSKT